MSTGADAAAGGLAGGRGAAGLGVAERLGLGDWGRLWAVGLEGVPPPAGGVAPVVAGELAALLEKLGLPAADLDDVVSTAVSVAESPDWRWLLERSVGRLVATMGDPDADRGPWPDWVGERYPLEQRCFFVHVFAATLPFTLAWHRSQAVPEAVVRATLSELSRHMALHRRSYGSTGVDNAWWVTLTLRGEIFDLGRLQFNRYHLGLGDETPPWYEGDEPRPDGRPAVAQGEELIGVHIPETGPMTPGACDDSFARAREFFTSVFPWGGGPGRRGRRVATCLSWLLDEQLCDYLAPESNIVRFQRRFRLVPGGWPGDHSILQFVFRRPLPRGDLADPELLDSLPQSTTLERAVVAHLRAGGHWYQRTGWVEL